MVDYSYLSLSYFQEAPMITVATLCLFVSSGSQMVAPLFFGKVIDAAQHSMGKILILQ